MRIPGRLALLFPALVLGLVLPLQAGPPLPPPAPHAGDAWQDPVSGLTFGWVPPGSFLMGSPEEDTGARANERPQHQVTFARGFWLGLTEVTQAQWRAVMGYNGSSFVGERLGPSNLLPEEQEALLPVEGVTWEEAKAFLARLDRKRGAKVYALPSEAEWEYACRAGSTETRPENLDDVAWYFLNSGSFIHHQGLTHPVGTKEANAWGFQDMLGNVEEWCEDTWHDSYKDAPANGAAWVTVGDQVSRVKRGGDWFSLAKACRPAFRTSFNPRSRLNNVGFRVVLRSPFLRP